MENSFKFELEGKKGKMRAGKIHTKHGIIETPIFMPVGTCGTVKGLTNHHLNEINPDIILGNTYHLMLRPTAERIETLGGLHKFMNWNKPILTDSGGFQVMSLSNMNKVTEEGVKFRSHIDGSLHMLTPERSMDIQHKLDADITMIFDHVVKYGSTEKKVKEAMYRSLRWAERSKNAFIKRNGYGLFAIVQGGNNYELRKKSAEELINIGFDGYAIGGMVGYDEELFQILDYAADMLPENKPRYLMGVGRPSDIKGAIERGIDMFDCVLPTRSGRNGLLFTSAGEVKIKHAKYAEDLSPIDEKCNCYACKMHTKAYIHHLFKADEMLAGILMTIHNLTFYMNLVRNIRKEILS
jgi:queuine tRNA-ribosyltransferase